MGKGEIASYERFLLFPQSFQRTCSADMLKQGLVWERVNLIVLILTTQEAKLFKTSWESEKIVVINNFSISHYRFYAIRELKLICVKFDICQQQMFCDLDWSFWEG